MISQLRFIPRRQLKGISKKFSLSPSDKWEAPRMDSQKGNSEATVENTDTEEWKMYKAHKLHKTARILYTYSLSPLRFQK